MMFDSPFIATPGKGTRLLDDKLLPPDRPLHIHSVVYGAVHRLSQTAPAKLVALVNRQ